VAVVTPLSEKTHAAVITAASAVVFALIVVLMWGPVARGLHEDSVRRWCTWAQPATTAELGPDHDLRIMACVDQALADPSFLAALRASL